MGRLVPSVPEFCLPAWPMGFSILQKLTFLAWNSILSFHSVRLDKAMANLEWMEMFPAARSEYLRFEGSDHRPMLTHFDQHLRKKKGMFRYDRWLGETQEVRKLVENTWKVSTDSVLTKINQIRRNLVDWQRAKQQRGKTGLSHTRNCLKMPTRKPPPIPLESRSSGKSLRMPTLRKKISGGKGVVYNGSTEEIKILASFMQSQGIGELVTNSQSSKMKLAKLSLMNARSPTLLSSSINSSSWRALLILPLWFRKLSLLK